MADEATPTETSVTETPTPDAPAVSADVAATETATADTALADADVVADGTALGGEAEADAPSEAGPPEAYELAAPEGTTIDPRTVEMATPVFKELGLSNESANKLMPVAAKFAEMLVEKQAEDQLAAAVTRNAEWLTEAKADAEIGGQHWDNTITSAARALDQLGFPKGSPLRVSLNESGYGNHPDMIRLMARVGKAIGEAAFVRADHNAQVKKTDAELFYGKKD